jgi:hypothetical protein
MAYPDLYSDESKILEATNIKVKSVSFDAVLTSRRLILLDSKKHMLPPQEILLATLKSVDSGENAIRDPTITLSIITNTGTTRQMILTFSKASGGERKREADEWLKSLRQHVSQSVVHPILPDIPTLQENENPAEPENVPADTLPPRIEIVNAPPQKKRIEISRPMKKIIESEPAMPKPVETSSLPAGSFCNRCGSRVPPESAFCNRCGTPVVREADLEAALHQQISREQPIPVSPPVEASPQPDLVPQPPETTPAAPATVSEVPQISDPLPESFGHTGEKKERTIEAVIQSIEPLIEDSVPRTEPAPLIPRPAALQALEQSHAETPAAPAEGSTVQWPVITPTSPAAGSPAAQPETPLPPVPQGGSGKGKTIAIALLAIVVIAAIAGVFLLGNPFNLINGGTPAPTGEPTGVPTVVTTVVTMPVTSAVTVTTTAAPQTAVTTTAAPASQIPQTGVWVRINYPNKFTGLVGTAGAEREVGDTGERFYQVSTSTGTVSAQIQKTDGSGDPLIVEVYKDGELVIKKSTTAPKGIVEIQVSLKPVTTPTPAPTIIKPVITTVPAANTTANATAGE